MSFLDKLIPGASRAVKSYYWLYVSAGLIPVLLERVIGIRNGTIPMDHWLDWLILILILAGQVVSTTMAYVDKTMGRKVRDEDR